MIALYGNSTAVSLAPGAPSIPWLRRLDIYFLLTLLFGLFCLYALSAPRTVALEDDGEFILAGYFLGVAHPPGYPLHTLFAYLFSLIPVGSVAYRIHLLSGFFGALAAGVAYVGVRQLGAAPARAITAALCLGLSEVYWSQSIVAEVYTLHLLLFELMWLFSLRLYQGFAGRRACLALAAASGLALANHWPLTVLAAPALLPLLWRRWKGLLTAPVIALGLLSALAPYAWMVARSHMEPTISFYGPLRSLSDIWFFISRSGYSGVDHNPMAGWEDKIQFFRFLAGEWTSQFTLGGAALAVLGLVGLWRRSQIPACLSLIWIVFVTSIVLVIRLDFEYFGQSKAAFRVYPLPAYFGTALLLGLGLETFAKWGADHTRARWAVPLISTALVGALIITSLPPNWRPRDNWAEAYASAVLHETPPNAVMVLESDWASYTIGYLHFIEGRCPNCLLMDPQGLLYPSRLFEPLRTPPAEHKKILHEYLSRVERPVVFTYNVPPGVDVTDRWLVQIARNGPRTEPPIQISAPAHDFFAERVARDHADDATVRTVQQDLRRHYAYLLALAGWAERAGLDRLCLDFFGCLGLVEGMMERPGGYNRIEAARLLGRAAQWAPADAHRWDRARFLEVRGLLQLAEGNKDQAALDLRAAIALSPDTTEDARRILGKAARLH